MTGEATPVRRDWNRSELLRRSLPFGLIVGLAWATVPLTKGGDHPVVLLAAGVLTIALVALSVLVPWRRLPRAAAASVPFAALVAVVMLRHAEGGASSGYGVLVLGPVLWLALYGSRAQLIAALASVALAFVAPILLFGAPTYPDDEWRRAILTTALATILGLVTQSLVGQIRANAAEAARQAAMTRRSETHLRAVMNSAADGIVAIAPNGLSTFANPAAARLLGRTVDELTNANLHALAHHSRADGSPYPPEECPTLETLERGVDNFVSNEVYWRKDGSSFPVEYRSTPMIEDGRAVGVVNTFTDITERTAAERLKNEFVSVVSHELRTPLTSIRGSLGLLQGGVLGDLSDEAAKMLGIAISNTDRLVRLINDILDVERIESGKAPLEIRECHLGELFEATVDLLRASADEARISLIAEPARCYLDADPDRIIQTLVNLVGNAIKFTPEGGSVRLAADPHDDVVRITVRDEGPGIQPDRWDEVFGRFAQLDSDDARLRGGSGLGLAIARGIVEQHGGRIWIDSSSAEQGSVFAVELPVAADRPGAAEVPADVSAVIVEDDRDLAAVLAATLERNCEGAVVVGDIEAALGAVDEYEPELLVLDLRLPDGSGQTLLERLELAGRLDDLSVIVYTALDLSEAQRDELQARARVVTKSRVPPDEFEGVMIDTLASARSGSNGAA